MKPYTGAVCRMDSGEIRGLCFTAYRAGQRKHVHRLMREKVMVPSELLEKAVLCIQPVDWK